MFLEYWGKRPKIKKDVWIHILHHNRMPFGQHPEQKQISWFVWGLFLSDRIFTAGPVVLVRRGVAWCSFTVITPVLLTGVPTSIKVAALYIQI